MANRSLPKSELIEKLKGLFSRESRQSEHIGAMCYSPASPPPKFGRCDNCHKTKLFEFWEYGDKSILKKKVREIKKHGYDASIKHLCVDCVAKFGIQLKDWQLVGDDPFYYVFFFKTKDKDEYHVTISDEVDDYSAVIAFLKNESTYMSKYGARDQVTVNLEVIRRMTGIRIG